MARPTIYTEELAKKILDRIAEGESVRSIARDDDMPNKSTIFDWALYHEKFSDQYDKARDIGMEVRAEEIEDIAETMEDVQRAKLVVDTKKWNMSKLKPKRFGEKVDHTSGGKPIPLLNLNAILRDNSNSEDSETEEKG